jgi:hypothetical protein
MTQNAITIDKGIPMPPRRHGGRHIRYPFAEMEVGDSFFHAGSASSVEAAASSYARHSGKRFSARYVAGGVRIWRIA